MMVESNASISASRELRDLRPLLASLYSMATFALREEKMARDDMENVPSLDDPDEFFAGGHRGDATSYVDTFMSFDYQVRYHTLQITSVAVHARSIILTLDDLSKRLSRSWAIKAPPKEKPENKMSGGAKIWANVDLIELIRFGGDWYRHAAEWRQFPDSPFPRSRATMQALGLSIGDEGEGDLFSFPLIETMYNAFPTYLQLEHALIRAYDEGYKSLETVGWVY